MKLLLVEDDIHLLENTKSQLISEGFQVETATNGNEAYNILKAQDFDCVILDINIPTLNGLQLLSKMREEGNYTSVILLTAYGELGDKLEGFRQGADDYITKPFFFKELLARILAQVRKKENGENKQGLIRIKDMTIDTVKKTFHRGGKEIELTQREYEILYMLAEAKGNPVSKKEMLAKVWGVSFEANTNTIEVFINFLRNKIDKGFEEKIICTRVGVGYYLNM